MDKIENLWRGHSSIKDFEVLKKIGDGSFSQVVLAKSKINSRICAIKIIDKDYVRQKKTYQYIIREHFILQKISHPHVAQLLFSFETTQTLFFGLELCNNGELREQIQKRRGLDSQTAQFYTAFIVEVLEYYRECQIVHRDMKPENLLIDNDGCIKVIDFGCVKVLKEDWAIQVQKLEEKLVNQKKSLRDVQREKKTEKRNVSFVGTADYISPEVLNNQDMSYEADLWALGCVLYQIFVTRPPYREPTEYLTWERVSKNQYDIPATVPYEAQDLIRKLLKLNPQERIGSKNLQEIKDHPFYKDTQWGKLRKQEAPFCLKPEFFQDDEDDEFLKWDMQSLSEQQSIIMQTNSEQISPLNIYNRVP